MTKRTNPFKRRGARTTSKPLRKYRIKGTLSWPDHELPVTCVITITKDGTITITTGRIPLNKDTFWIVEKVPGKGRLTTWACLRGTTKDGLRIDSDHVTMSGRNNHFGNRSTTALHGQLSMVTVHHGTPPPTAANLLLVYHTIGMQGFSVQHATTRLGNIRMAGPAEIEDYDHLAGRIQITAHDHEKRMVEEWTSEADEHIAQLLLIISLAEGKLIEWSIRESATSDGTLFRTDCYGSKHTGIPRDGIGHFLNLQPILDLAATHYTADLRSITGIELAIRLLLAQPSHVELQLIAAMTALEHLISRYTKQQPVGPPLPKKMFATIRKALEDTYDETTAQLPAPPDEQERKQREHALRRVRDRIAKMNDTVFNDRLFAMLRSYRVPLVGIEDRITKAVSLRHDIIHTGTHGATFADFYLHVAVLRELLKRIILTLLNYQGQYISFLNGQEFLEFPPTNTTIK
jgi:hypothetical protein